MSLREATRKHPTERARCPDAPVMRRREGGGMSSGVGRARRHKPGPSGARLGLKSSFPASGFGNIMLLKATHGESEPQLSPLVRRLLPLVPGSGSKRPLAPLCGAHHPTVPPQKPPDMWRPKKERAGKLGGIQQNKSATNSKSSSSGGG